ncbi:MAG: GIY-YIG nuclease family protein [Candidatus Thiodiazotropha taylori]|nr:GIY-YIG nuclease family protein [Candidatus Thiodiazotropha taylori]
MITHAARMREISFWAIPKNGSPDRELLERRVEEGIKNPEINKKVKKIYEEVLALSKVQSENGAGFPVDQQLREFNREYNNRAIMHSLRSMPGSFNVMEAFNEFYPPSATFRLRSEQDHIFSFTGFIDYITSRDDEFDISSISEYTEEGVIYSFNSVSNPLDITFSTVHGLDYGVIGFALVRFSNEVSILMLSGESCDLQAKSIELKEIDLSHRFPHRKELELDKNREIKAEPVAEGVDLWKTLLLMRVDIKAKTIDARYVYQDIGPAFYGITDDLHSYLDEDGNFIAPELEKMAKESVANLDKYTSLIEVGKLGLILPKYFSENDGEIDIERHQTEYGINRNRPTYRKINKLVDLKYRIASRNVLSLVTSGQPFPSNVGILTPELKIETSGYWRKLGPQEVGMDKTGQAIHGRTWVQKTISWVHETPGTVYAERKKNIRKGDNPGYIYVMRSAAHEKDIFKIGLTQRTSDLRSAELSRTTSSPDHFLVVEDWEVSDCILAEKLIHEELDQYRINPRREYFRAKYSVIFSAINNVIETLELSA